MQTSVQTSSEEVQRISFRYMILNVPFIDRYIYLYAAPSIQAPAALRKKQNKTKKLAPLKRKRERKLKFHKYTEM